MSTQTTEQVVNVASVPHRTPFRYPGGKTWLVPTVRRWLSSLESKPKIFCEPFCGGGIVSMSVLFEDLTERVELVELDEDVAAVWETMLNGQGGQLIERIAKFKVSKESVRDLLDRPHPGQLDQAFATIIRNRVQRGGILAPGASLMKTGENGRGLLSRWYPDTLQTRIRGIRSQRQRITFTQGDGIAWLRGRAHDSSSVFFIDPPYTVAGRRLYRHSEIDHAELFEVTATLNGDFLMTYDDADPIRRLAAKHYFDTHTIRMKNTHHRIMSELLVGRNLDWARRASGEFRQDALFEL